MKCSRRLKSDPNYVELFINPKEDEMIPEVDDAVNESDADKVEKEADNSSEDEPRGIQKRGLGRPREDKDRTFCVHDGNTTQRSSERNRF